MPRTIGIGIQGFGKLIENDCLYIDKTYFIKDWWENKDDVTLITRPRRFGKTLTMNMLEKFFSIKYAGSSIFEGLSIWKYEKYRKMQEAYVNGYWEQMADLIRKMFSSALKDNRYLERALMTGITRISKESVFSDLNHLKVVTVISKKYETVFGFTEAEVLWALEEYGMLEQRLQVKEWYDGFQFGDCDHIVRSYQKNTRLCWRQRE